MMSNREHRPPSETADRSDRISSALSGIYVHIPFCIRKCQYCDFCSFPGADAGTVEKYIQRLCRELAAVAPQARGRVFDTVYFGGGTPTLLSSADLVCLLSAVKTHYAVTDTAEITLECNPATAAFDTLQALRSAGFNRLSIGAQSFEDRELAILGRVHDARAIRDTFALAQAAGFENISLDLMYGIPHQTPTSFAASLQRAISLGAQHLSVYSLIVEEGTPFYERRHTLPLPDEDTLCDMTAQLIQTLEAAGYARYEISNYALVGYASRHNLHYWNSDDYLGFGVAAHSFWNGVRTAHSRDLAAYLAGENILETTECPGETAARDEYVMLRLRLCDGVDKAAFRARFGVSFDALYGSRAAPYVRAGLLSQDEAHMAFTARGFEVSNAVLSELLYLC